MKNNQKLMAKDFITLGIFSAISSVLMFICAITNMTPHTYLLYPVLYALVNGVIFILIMTKVPKKGAVVIFGIVPAICLAATGVEGMIVALSFIICAIVADLVIGKNRLNFKKILLGYLIYSCNLSIGGQFRLFVFTDDYLEWASKGGLNETYVESMRKIATFGNWAICIIATLVAALIGAYIGKALLKKHLERAGIV